MVFLDFEFNGVSERQLNLICVSVTYKGHTNSLWLEGDEVAKNRFRSFIEAHKHETFVAYNVIAEGHSLASLGFDPLSFRWVDLYLEYTMLQNCNNKFLYGRQLKKGQEIVTEPKPRWYKELEEEINGWEDGKELSKKLKEKHLGRYAEGEANLVACIYKLLNIVTDSEHKTKMRRLIIAGGPFSEEDKVNILKYCDSDTKLLPDLYKEIVAKQKEPEVTDEERYFRGRVGAICAKITAEGYPVDVEKVKIFQENLPIAIFDLCETINKTTNTSLFVWKPNRDVFQLNKSVLQNEIDSRFKDVWPKTATGKYKLDSDTFDQMLGVKHAYNPKDVLEQYVRYTHFNSSTSSMKKQEGEGNFLSACGKDDRIRPWLGPYGAQSARFTPGAKHFLFLKSAWMRALCVPKKGKVIIGMDYSQQEFLLQGCISLDEKIYETYSFGDIYEDFGRKTGIVTEERGSELFKIQRSAAKAAVLGMGYGMQKHSLSRKITKDTKDAMVTTPEKAQEIINSYYSLYSTYKKYKETVLRDYKLKGYLKLKDGWVMYGDNPSDLSVLNVPIQGMGSCILRKALELCYYNDLVPIIPLHDALYIESDLENLETDISKLHKVMKEASGFYFEGTAKEWASSVRVDAEVWGPDIEPNLIWNESKKQYQNIPIKIQGIKVLKQNLHVDERSETEYESYKKYFEVKTKEEIQSFEKRKYKAGFSNGLKQISLFNQED